MLNITLIAVIAFLTLLAYYKGRSVLFCVISSFYPAIVVYKAFPYTEKAILFTKNKDQIFFSHVGLFLVIFFLIYFIMIRITHANSYMGGMSGFFDSILLSVSVTALTIILSLHILPRHDIYNLSGSVEKFFTSEFGYFLSLVVPLAVVYHLSKRTFTL